MVKAETLEENPIYHIRSDVPAFMKQISRIICLSHVTSSRAHPSNVTAVRTLKSGSVPMRALQCLNAAPSNTRVQRSVWPEARNIRPQHFLRRSIASARFSWMRRKEIEMCYMTFIKLFANHEIFSCIFCHF